MQKLTTLWSDVVKAIFSVRPPSREKSFISFDLMQNTSITFSMFKTWYFIFVTLKDSGTYIFSSSLARFRRKSNVKCGTLFDQRFGRHSEYFDLKLIVTVRYKNKVLRKSSLIIQY